MAQGDEGAPSGPEDEGTDPFGASQPANEGEDRFDLVGREIAGMLRNLAETTSRAQADAEREAAEIRAKAERDASAAAEARLAAAATEADELRGEARRQLDEAEQARSEAMAWAERVATSRTEASQSLSGVLADLDRAVQEISRLEAQAAATRTEMEAVRSSLEESRHAFRLVDAVGPPPELPEAPAWSDDSAVDAGGHEPSETGTGAMDDAISDAPDATAGAPHHADAGQPGEPQEMATATVAVEMEPEVSSNGSETPSGNGDDSYVASIVRSAVQAGGGAAAGAGRLMPRAGSTLDDAGQAGEAGVRADDDAITLTTAQREAAALRASADADRAEARQIRQRALDELSRAEEILAEAEAHRARAWAEVDAIRAESERRQAELARAIEARLLAVLDLVRSSTPPSDVIDLRDSPSSHRSTTAPDSVTPASDYLSRAVDAAIANVLGQHAEAGPSTNS